MIRGEEFCISAFLDVLTSNHEDISLREQCEDDSAVRRLPVFTTQVNEGQISV